MAATAESVDLGELHEAEPFLEEPQASTKGIKSVGFGFTLIAALGCAIYAAFWAIGPQSPHLNEDGVISFVSSSLCSAGVLTPQASICCPKSCGTCGGPGCNEREGGGANCCAGIIRNSNKTCESSGDVACNMPMEVWSGCHSHANCGKQHLGWRLQFDRDECIKADCKDQSLIYPEHYKHRFEKCDTGDNRPLYEQYKGLCVEEFWSGCHSHASCDGGERDKCIEDDCTKQGLKYPSKEQVWERCGGLLSAKYKGLCE